MSQNVAVVAEQCGGPSNGAAAPECTKTDHGKCTQLLAPSAVTTLRFHFDLEAIGQFIAVTALAKCELSPPLGSSLYRA